MWNLHNGTFNTAQSHVKLLYNGSRACKQEFPHTYCTFRLHRHKLTAKRRPASKEAKPSLTVNSPIKAGPAATKHSSNCKCQAALTQKYIAELPLCVCVRGKNIRAEAYDNVTQLSQIASRCVYCGSLIINVNMIHNQKHQILDSWL